MAEFRAMLNSNVHGDLYNGVLFNQRYHTRESNEHQPEPPGLVIYPGYQQQQFHPNEYTSIHESPRSESPSGSSGSGSENVNKRWEATEVKILIFAYKDHRENLNKSKSSKGKKSVWEKIFDTFTEHCKTAGIGSSRSLTQIKEKWRALFERYKAIVDNSKKTGRGRESFQFFEIMDEFLGCSDKVRPKFVKETQLLENKKNRESENLDKEEATKDLPVVENCKDGASPVEENVPQQRSRKRKRSQEEGQISESDKALINLLQSQQESIRQSEERDKEAIQAMMKFQADSERRHQEFMVSVLGKLGDIFSSKNKFD
ncbi:uncharacterized protein [Montipora capricornis]|uniref:uncharacterized protein n=1 Tax=Montipora capricornis TaxID=246305 RepID=UPI0035F1D7C9